MTTVPDRLQCQEPPCTAIQATGFIHCLAHLHPQQLDQFLETLKPGTDLDARGTTFSEDLLGRLMGAGWVFGDVNFEKAEFRGATKIGPLIVDSLVLDGAIFERHARVEVHGSRVSCVGARFENGVTLRVNNAAIDATDVIFGSVSSVSTSLAFPLLETSSPRLDSLRGTDVSNLVLVDIDLSWCLFAGAHRLDQLRLEDRCRFNRPPTGLRRTRRQVLAEEYLARGWVEKHPHLSDALPIRWERLAALYRSLRKAFEDSKNEAGAGDFYYGEMEARRHSEVTPRTERRVLWSYWLLSGYGQRGDRAVAWLGVLVAVVCGVLFTVGLPGGVEWTWARVDQSLRIGMGAVVFREAGQTLTSAGSWTVMVARFAGPVLLALAVLAIRARVKR